MISIAKDLIINDAIDLKIIKLVLVIEINLNQTFYYKRQFEEGQL